MAYYALPMVSFNDDAKQAASDGRWGRMLKSYDGSFRGAAFYATIGQSGKFIGYLKMYRQQLTKLQKATAKINKFIANVGKLERKANGVRQSHN